MTSDILSSYFQALIDRVESSDIDNAGTDKDGFYKPTRAVLLQRLHLLRDLHGKAPAKAMVKTAWQHVVEELPPDWLVMNGEQKAALKKVLS